MYVVSHQLWLVTCFVVAGISRFFMRARVFMRGSGPGSVDLLSWVTMSYAFSQCLLIVAGFIILRHHGLWCVRANGIDFRGAFNDDH